MYLRVRAQRARAQRARAKRARISSSIRYSRLFYDPGSLLLLRSRCSCVLPLCCPQPCLLDHLVVSLVPNLLLHLLVYVVLSILLLWMRASTPPLWSSVSALVVLVFC